MTYFVRFIQFWPGLVGVCIWLSLSFQSATASPSIEYVVRSGDTLSHIAKKSLKPVYGWQDLAKKNSIADPNFLDVGLRLRLPMAWLVIEPDAARLVRLAGVVQVAKAQEPWGLAQPGQLLSAGHRLKIGPSGSAVLKLADQTEMVLQSDTQVQLDTVSIYGGGYMADTNLRLQSGRVEVRANPNRLLNRHLRIVTPSAITAVRGTELIVEGQNDQSVIQVTEGSVEVSNSWGKVMVAGGFGSLVKSERSPELPMTLKDAPVLLDVPSVFSEFPLRMKALASPEASHWVLELSQERPRALAADRAIGNNPSSKLDAAIDNAVFFRRVIKTDRPDFDLGVLGNGRYQLRVWSVDVQGRPSRIRTHDFEIQIPRKLYSGPTAIHSNWLEDELNLQLEPLFDGRRYFVQLTEDVQGDNTIWYSFDGLRDAVLPKQPNQAKPYYLWIWVY